MDKTQATELAVNMAEQASSSTLGKIQLAIAASAPKAMYGGGTAGGLGFLLSNEFMGLVGVLIALAGFGVNWYYKRKEHQFKLNEDKRKQEEHDARMGLLT